MAKRPRASRSAYRPGGQGPSRAKETSPSRDDALDAAIEESAEVSVVETTEIAIAEPAPVARRPRASRRSARGKADSLESRAAAEEAWVRDDLRSIGIISAVLVVGLAIAWVLFVPMNIAGLY